MIKFEHTEVIGWEATIRGMRNPKESWDRSDSIFKYTECEDCSKCVYKDEIHFNEAGYWCDKTCLYIGPNDLKLMKQLASAGPVHAKYRRYIDVYVDITAPLYWWKEFETYRTVVADNPFDIEFNSCSSMHCIHKKEFELDDFSHEHLFEDSLQQLVSTIDTLNKYRDIYMNGGTICLLNDDERVFEAKSKDVWYQIIQLLPSSYNQKRTVKMNYEVLANMYEWRHNHKLDDWRCCNDEEGIVTGEVMPGFCDWIKTLPYNEIITLEFDD